MFIRKFITIRDPTYFIRTSERIFTLNELIMDAISFKKKILPLKYAKDEYLAFVMSKILYLQRKENYDSSLDKGMLAKEVN